MLMSRARILMRRVHEADGPVDAADAEAAEAAVREVLALVEERVGDDVRLAARRAESLAMLAELAARGGDPRAGAELFARAADGFVAAGVPWFAVEYEARLAQLAHHLGDPPEAERALRAALEHGGELLDPVGRAQLHLQLGEVVGERGDNEEAAGHALEAAHWADEAGEGPTLGAWARHQLGGFLVRQGRWAEAAEVLESALYDLTVETHGDGTVVQTLWWLGDCLAELGEHRAAAERRLRAADIARHWPDQQDHAALAHLAAESLGQAGMTVEAERAYARAGELWEALGNPHGLVRALRARAWLALRGDDGGSARGLMRRALEACGAAAEAAAAAEDASPGTGQGEGVAAGAGQGESRGSGQGDELLRLRAEVGHTHRQFADLLARDEDLEEALVQVRAAIDVFAGLGAVALHSRTGAELAAGWMEADLGRSGDAGGAGAGGAGRVCGGGRRGGGGGGCARAAGGGGAVAQGRVRVTGVQGGVCAQFPAPLGGGFGACAPAGGWFPCVGTSPCVGPSRAAPRAPGEGGSHACAPDRAWGLLSQFPAPLGGGPRTCAPRRAWGLLAQLPAPLGGGPRTCAPRRGRAFSRSSPRPWGGGPRTCAPRRGRAFSRSSSRPRGVGVIRRR
ncbi:hypothetical protein GCM10020256_20530 [Streptomyces thermocoprophilus]